MDDQVYESLAEALFPLQHKNQHALALHELLQVISNFYLNAAITVLENTAFQSVT